MAHHRRHGSMAALTPVPVQLPQLHIIPQLEFNSQLSSVVLRVMERSGRVLYTYRESNSFDDLVAKGINKGVRPGKCFMTVASYSTLLIFAEFPLT